VQELISTAVDYEKQKGEQATLANYLEEVALLADIDALDEEGNFVTLMTVHSAKGLEFPIVFLPGLEEGIFPGMQSTVSDDEVEEERRLAYVAITRAKDKLFITHTRERLIYGRTQFNPVSRFVNEIDETCILYDEIAVSAGERGHQMILHPEKLCELTNAQMIDLTK
jgi:DNA helicase-2/ATP-dependent DNA helicase PcrA